MKKIIVMLISVMFLLTATISFAGVSNEANAGAAAGASVDDHSSNKSKVIDRDFVGSSPSVIGNTHALFIPDTGSDVSFRPITEMVRFGNVWSESALKNLAAGADYNDHFAVVNDFPKEPNILPDGQRYIVIILENAPKEFTQSAPFDAEADDFQTNTFQLVAVEALKAIENGDNILFVEYQGYGDKVLAKGWSLGSHSAGGVISDSGKLSGVVGTGLGYSKNNVGREMKPWIRGYSGYIYIDDIGNYNVVNAKRIKTGSNNISDEPINGGR